MSAIKTPLLLLAVWIALDVVAFGLRALVDLEGEEQWLVVLIWPQFVVCSGWVVVGQHGVKTTAAAVLGGLIVFCVAAELVNHENQLLANLIVALVYLTIINLPLAIVRLCGWRFQLAEGTGVQERPPWQFGVRDMLLLMGVTALLATAWRDWSTPPPPAPENDLFGALGRGIGMVLSVLVWLAFMLPWSFWALVLLFRPVQVWAVALVVYTLMGMMLSRYLETAGTIQELGLVIVLLLSASMMLTHVSLLRWRGFRLQWTRPAWHNRLFGRT